IDRILRRCLHKDPAHRYPTLAELQSSLKRLRADYHSSQLSSRSLLTPYWERIMVRAFVTILAVTALTAGVIFWKSRPKGERTINAALTRSEEHTSELQSRSDLVCRLLLEKK